MRMLTLKGFLTQYVKELSKSNSLNLNTLAAEAEAGNYRLCAPLVLYAVSTEKADHLQRSLGSSSTADEMKRMLQELSGEPLEQLLASREVPREYKKVWEAFRVAKNAPEREKALKEAISNSQVPTMLLSTTYLLLQHLILQMAHGVTLQLQA